MKTLLSLFLLPFILTLRLAADTTLEAGIPAEMREIFEGSRASDWGEIESDRGRSKELVEYIRSNWRHLMANIKDVPSHGETTVSAIALVALAAEDLPPEEYLDFLDAFLSLYSEGMIPDHILELQLFGIGKKKYFISVNYAHPRVQDFLKRTKELVPKENKEVQTTIAELAAGEGSDMYLANASENSPPPETLPGIKLRRPFESMIPDFMRDRREQREASRRPTKEGEMAAESESGRSFPIIALAVALLALGAAIGIYHRRRKLLGERLQM